MSDEKPSELDEIVAKIGELLEAYVTRRILRYHGKLVSDYGLEKVNPDSNLTVRADEDQPLQGGL